MNNMNNNNAPILDIPGTGAPGKAVSTSPEPMVAGYLNHELRAPLTSIRSALFLLEEAIARSLKPEQRQLLSLAIRNSDRLSGLINDIMDYHKIQSGKLTLESRALSPRNLIQESIDSMNAWAISKHIKILNLLDKEPLPRIQGDAKRIVQILINLLSNAIKFTPSGGRIELSARPGQESHKGTVIFSVKDSGQGIHSEDLQKIFYCFEQSAAGSKVGNGTGLGLAIARSMVELHGGKIWAESEWGAGSLFQFSIPIHPKDMARPIEIYPKPTQYHGIIYNAFQRLNSFIGAFL